MAKSKAKQRRTNSTKTKSEHRGVRPPTAGYRANGKIMKLGGKK